MGLVLLAGGIGGVRKSIRGSQQTLEDLESIFRPSRLWPNLASWNRDDFNFLYLYDPYAFISVFISCVLIRAWKNHDGQRAYQNHYTW